MAKPTKKISSKRAIEDLSLMLMYLTSFKDRDKMGCTRRRAWKGYDFKVLSSLSKKGFIEPRSPQSKSLYLTDAGIQRAKSLLNNFNIQNDVK